jgi:hypothetical protein
VASVTQISARRSPQELPQWCNATWDDYVAQVTAADAENFRIFYRQGRLFVDLGWEGIDVQGARVMAFCLSPEGLYEQTLVLIALAGLEIALVEQAYKQLATESNGAVAQRFAQQLS